MRNRVFGCFVASIPSAGRSDKADQALAVEALKGLANALGFFIRGAASQRPLDCFRRRLRMIRVKPDINLITVFMGGVHGGPSLYMVLTVKVPASPGGTAMSAHV